MTDKKVGLPKVQYVKTDETSRIIYKKVLEN